VSTSDLEAEYLSGETLQFDLPSDPRAGGTSPASGAQAAQWQHAEALHQALESGRTYTQGLDDTPWAEGHHYTMYVMQTKSEGTVEKKK
jgi:hypothetical protein